MDRCHRRATRPLTLGAASKNINAILMPGKAKQDHNSLSKFHTLRQHINLASLGLQVLLVHNKALYCIMTTLVG
ncbi:hypothetical protein MNBD_NITROSPINAE04-97 [hydrothermal vent metagenome]|uniref:Uncharacterized protein n=1 Tax=hydrothermal vent metagenome TaxID=652676 RepID=A0A3B1CQK6_9ZZZZ